jgi:hypothetical protein
MVVACIHGGIGADKLLSHFQLLCHFQIYLLDQPLSTPLSSPPSLVSDPQMKLLATTRQATVRHCWLGCQIMISTPKFSNSPLNRVLCHLHNVSRSSSLRGLLSKDWLFTIIWLFAKDHSKRLIFTMKNEWRRSDRYEGWWMKEIRLPDWLSDVLVYRVVVPLLQQAECLLVDTSKTSISPFSPLPLAPVSEWVLVARASYIW